MIAAEVVYAARHEYCQSTCDFIARRTRLASLDADAAEAALPEVRGPEEEDTYLFHSFARVFCGDLCVACPPACAFVSSVLFA